MHSYTIELERINSRKTLHAELARVFLFPAYYGRNWDAFDECVGELALPASVNVLGFDGFRFRLPKEAKRLAQCLRAMAERSSPGHFRVQGLP
jgi:ribonuclease inhibitor